MTNAPWKPRGSGPQISRPRWWSARRAQNLKPATYRCPVCGGRLPALSEHMLILPEGDARRRRHAHTACVLAERRAGRLPTREEWLATQPRPPGLSSRLRKLGARLIGRAEKQ